MITTFESTELDPFERLSMIVIADGPWSIANGLMTPTLKIRRGALEGTYERMIEEWKAQGPPVVWESSPAMAGRPYVADAATETAGRPK